MVLSTVNYELPLYFYSMCYSQEMHEIKAVITFHIKKFLTYFHQIFHLGFALDVVR